MQNRPMENRMMVVVLFAALVARFLYVNNTQQYDQLIIYRICSTQSAISSKVHNPFFVLESYTQELYQTTSCHQLTVFGVLRTSWWMATLT